MTSRATPPVVPTFGDPSGNQQYTSYFDGVVKSKDVKEGKKGGKLEDAHSRKATNVVRNPTKHAKAKDHKDMESQSAGIKSSSAPHRYEGRLGNRFSSHPAGNMTPPNTKNRSASSSLPCDNHAEGMKFGKWEENPAVPITAAFDIAEQGRGVKLFKSSPAFYSDGGRQGTPSHKKIAHDKFSCWTRFNPKKLWKKLFS